MSSAEPEPEEVVGFDNLEWEVHKFGGTSVQNATCYESVATIIEEQLGLVGPEHDGPRPDINLAVVVSAMGGKPKTTDLLLSTVEAAANRDDETVESLFSSITEKHLTCLEALFSEDKTRDRLKRVIESDLDDIRDILKTVSLMKWQASRIRELISGYGEIWSAQILSALLSLRAEERADNDVDRSNFLYLDARRVITVDEDAIENGSVCWNLSSEKLEKVYSEDNAKIDGKLHYIITGYVASNTYGVSTTLQRDGSDYSAAIMGKLLQSRCVTIWTDVDGVLSADPRRVPDAFVIPEVSYNEAMELAYFGAKVIHPKTIQPVISISPNIPIYIRNTFYPSFPGTRIYTTSTSHTNEERSVCGFSSIDNIVLINVEGSGMIGVPGVAKRLFGTLESVGVNVILISQASSEHSITFATVQNQAQQAKEAIEEEFHRELKASRISQIEVKSPCSIIAAVGDGMMMVAGVSGRFFSALGDAKINVLAISQGCSERNISAVVSSLESTRALRAVHAAFRLSHATVRLGIVGMNELGNSLLTLLENQRGKIRKKFEVDLQVCAVIESGSTNKFVCLKNDNFGCSESITLPAYDMFANGLESSNSGTVTFDKEVEAASVCTGGMNDFKERLISDDCAHHVIFDCTGEKEVGELHAAWLEGNINVVTANNWGLGGPRRQRDSITSAQKVRGKFSAEYLCGVTVGGALPVINTLRSLLNSGDKIHRMDGIISVSMSYILFRISPPPDADRNCTFDESISQGLLKDNILSSINLGNACSFADAVREAVALGLMEDDPRKDFNNDYTSRCLMILAKELGIDQSISPQDIQYASDKLVEDDIDGNHITEEIENKVQAKVQMAREKGFVLRQVASIDVAQRQIKLKLVEVPETHIFAVTPPSSECVRFFTESHSLPLIIQGPSAGADSTASALLAELLSHMRSKVGPRFNSISRPNSMNKLPV
mmetsp:Transcript_18505/g.27968  ORF Transcript_18505/g.27968 Transcript_18505/m.27968 type:complete len:951 (+) Transcript_18505:35-2887(+)